MTFEKVFDIGDILTAITIILAFIGGCFGFYQWYKSVKVKRAEYINELTEKIRTDKDIKDMVYVFDYDIAWYTSSFHGSGELERKVDKTLSYFSYICYLKQCKLISNKEFGFFKYEIERILMNPQLQNYFFNLYHFSNKFNVPFTFIHLYNYGKKEKMFDKEFYNSTSKNYAHYLNF